MIIVSKVSEVAWVDCLVDGLTNGLIGGLINLIDSLIVMYNMPFVGAVIGLAVLCFCCHTYE